jgi:uncharacterized membrane protein
MTKGSIVFLLGILLILIPYLGIPLWWKQIISVALGVLLVSIGYALRRKDYLATIADDHHLTSDTFVETTPQLFAEKG